MVGGVYMASDFIRGTERAQYLECLETGARVVIVPTSVDIYGYRDPL